MKFSGKKILFLGTNSGTVDLLIYAKRNGAKTYVTDNLPPERSEAKRNCDFSYSISTADTERLVCLVKHEQIDAVLSGISEFNIMQAMAVCSICGLPFFCTERQWNIVERKDLFRSLCILHSLPVPYTYYVGQSLPIDFSHFSYPLIVKPIDNGGSTGISICESSKSFVSAFSRAISNSSSKTAIVEEYIVGDEFTAHYSVAFGRVALVSLDRRFPATSNGGYTTTIPIARIYPPDFIDEYFNQINEKIISMVKSVEVSVGSFFVQGIYNRKCNSFYIFEGGLRAAAETPNRFLRHINGVDFFHNYVDFAINGDVGEYDITLEDPKLKGHICCVLSIASKGGKISHITGTKDVCAQLGDIVDYEQRYYPGMVTPVSDALRQIVLRFVIICSSMNKLVEDVSIINRHVFIWGENGEDISIKFQQSQFI